MGQNSSQNVGGTGFNLVDYVVKDTYGNVLTQVDGPIANPTQDDVGKYWITTNGGAWANVKINYITGADVIPEPATATLGLLGLAALVMRRRV